MFRPLERYYHTKKGGNMIRGVGMKITAKDNDTQKRIKTWINFYGWNLYQLKKRTDLPDSTIRGLFSENRDHRVSTIRALCRAFGISLSVFFSDEDVLPEKGSEVWHIIRIWGQLDQEGKDLFKAMLHYVVKRTTGVSGKRKEVMLPDKTS